VANHYCKPLEARTEEDILHIRSVFRLFFLVDHVPIWAGEGVSIDRHLPAPLLFIVTGTAMEGCALGLVMSCLKGCVCEGAMCCWEGCVWGGVMPFVAKGVGGVGQGAAGLRRPPESAGLGAPPLGAHGTIHRFDAVV
jgi:hypothetical protein